MEVSSKDMDMDIWNWGLYIIFGLFERAVHISICILLMHITGQEKYIRPIHVHTTLRDGWSTIPWNTYLQKHASRRRFRLGYIH